MREELDRALVEKYPRLFKNRYAPMTETCMCWGFACGDGWFNIIDILCSNIDSHIKWVRKQRAQDLRRVRAQKKGYDALVKFIAGNGQVRDWHYTRATELMNEPIQLKKKVPYVVVEQVKEKFGTLRFYYSGGDEVIDGMVRMAESMTAVTCETCGDVGSTRGRGWIRTLCDKHEAEHQEKMKERA